jgi:hypothetical protein
MTSRSFTIAAFDCIGLAIVLLLVYSHRADARVERLSAVLLRLMRPRTARIALLLAWWWAGWHFLAYARSA